MIKRGYLLGTVLTLLALLLLLAVGGSQAEPDAQAGRMPTNEALKRVTTHYVSARQPAQGPQHELAATRPYIPAGQSIIASSTYTNPWQLVAHLPGAVIPGCALGALVLSFSGPCWAFTYGFHAIAGACFGMTRWIQGAQ